MIGFFKRTRASSPDLDALGRDTLAVPVADGAAVPAGAFAVLFDEAGRIRRLEAGARVLLAEGERAVCAHPGPYRIDLTPFAGAPEIGLAVSLAVDTPDPRLAQQRFDLYVAAEVAVELTLADLAGRLEQALRHELELGNLDLPPCTSVDEWHAFRSGLDRLLYMRFGLMVDDCLPVDLGDRVDYAAMLRARAIFVASAPAPADASAQARAPQASPGSTDRQALRRLFLELPSVMNALRMVTPAAGTFSLQRALLQRLDLASLQVGAMPALELAGPGSALAGADQARRASASLRAAATIDEAWGWLARVQDECDAELFDEFDRIAANLEAALAERRAVQGEAR